MDAERQYMGGSRSKVWTYLILLGVLIVGVVVANFALSNPKLAQEGVASFLGLPGWVFPSLTFVIGGLVWWLGLKVETDWPEAVGAFMVAGSVAAGEVMIGWNHFKLGGLGVMPFVIPAAAFLILLAVGMVRSK